MMTEDVFDQKLNEIKKLIDEIVVDLDTGAQHLSAYEIAEYVNEEKNLSKEGLKEYFGLTDEEDEEEDDDDDYEEDDDWQDCSTC